MRCEVNVRFLRGYFLVRGVAIERAKKRNENKEKLQVDSSKIHYRSSILKQTGERENMTIVAPCRHTRARARAYRFFSSITHIKYSFDSHFSFASRHCHYQPAEALFDVNRKLPVSSVVTSIRAEGPDESVYDAFK